MSKKQPTRAERMASYTRIKRTAPPDWVSKELASAGKEALAARTSKAPKSTASGKKRPQKPSAPPSKEGDRRLRRAQCPCTVPQASRAGERERERESGSQEGKSRKSA